MSVDEARLLLHDAARDAWGPEAALVLMGMPPPTGWADVATKRDLDALEERITLRFDGELARTERRILHGNVATLLAALATVTAIPRLT